ncbi:hypothetical protein HHK36_027851 [Tetracentron sinense]|uniref:Alpha/beta hydrolase fold-3 domain-containing protein n=1 Tax=Tetracentron sinense TaxID=13715 RepID=A0A835D3X5_TETSI|nr:hypothetical protein HHK36_027851 [Tetracentron sinense]
MSRFDPYEHLSMILKPDGTLTRIHESKKVPPTGDHEESLSDQPFLTKDVPLNTDNKTWVRIFRPTKIPSNNNSIASQLLPIIIYFHSGGIILFGAADMIIHELCGCFATEFPAIVVSVEYRLVPENRLPAAYDDAIDAVLWVRKQALDSNGERWLRDFADFSRCFLAGCSTGGNIAFLAGLRALDIELEPVRISGLILNQPLFGGVQRTESELMFATDEITPLPAVDLVWDLALPIGADRDHWFCNPMVEGPHHGKIGLLGRCLVIGYGGDLTIDRQQEFVRMLVRHGVQVVAQFDDIGFHGIDLVDPRRALARKKKNGPAFVLQKRKAASPSVELRINGIQQQMMRNTWEIASC